MYVFSLFLLSNAIFLPQAMDLYYHNESDPDSYCCPGDNSKSPVVLYSSTSSRLSFFPIRLSHCDSGAQSLIPLLSFSIISHLRSRVISLYYLHFCLFSPSIQNNLPPFILCLFSSCLLFPFRPNLMAVGAKWFSLHCTHTHTHTQLCLTLPLGSLIQSVSSQDNNCCS